MMMEGGSMLAQAGVRFVRVLTLWSMGCVLALPAQARYGGGIGTPDSPFLIVTAEHLSTMGLRPGDWDKCFILVADIDLGERGLAELKTVGTAADGPFSGVFDGNGRTIFALRRSGTYESYLGLFGLVDGGHARVENLMLADPNVAAGIGRYVGAMVGFLRSGTITNCHVLGGSVAGENFVGGLVGKNEGGTITDSTVSTTVHGVMRVGGLVGQSYFGKVERCRAEGTVRGLSKPDSWAIGGLIGENSNSTVAVSDANCVVTGDSCVGGLVGDNPLATVDRCCARGVVQGGGDVGGLLGRSNGGAITDCYALAEVQGGDVVGGLLGRHGPSCYCQVYEPGALARSYAAGKVTGVTNVGGLVGLNERSNVEGSFWDMEATGCQSSDGGAGKSTSQMCDLATYTDAGWDFVPAEENVAKGIWRLCTAEMYPRFSWEPLEEDAGAEKGSSYPTMDPASGEKTQANKP
jgi:hypothetical protein